MFGDLDQSIASLMESLALEEDTLNHISITKFVDFSIDHDVVKQF